jgi:hypothetical protein
MDLPKAEQAIVNGIYAAIAWLLLDFGFLFQEHGTQMPYFLISRPELAIGAIIVIACIVGLIYYKSRLAAISLFLLFLVPLVLRAIQGIYPSDMLFFFSLILLYFFLAAILGAFSYHHLSNRD